jgi:hypothetical protein
MFPSDTASLTTHAIALVFYVAIAVFSITSALALYSLVRYSRDKLVVTGTGLTYIILAVTLFTIALTQLRQIQL